MEHDVSKLSTISLTISEKPPRNAITGQMYYNTAYNTMQMFTSGGWMSVESSGTVLGLMTDSDREKILRNKEFFTDKIFVIINANLQLDKHTYAKHEHILQLIQGLGVEILWHNELIPHIGTLRCIIIKDIHDVNLIRLAFEELVCKIMDCSQVIEDMQL